MTAELAASPRGPDSTPVEYGGRRGEGASLLDVLAHTDTQSHITVCMHVCIMSCIGLAAWGRGTTAVVYLYYLHAMWSWCVNTQ